MEIDWWTLALQTVNFLVVVWLLSRFLYRPVRRMIEAREAADRAAAEDAQKKTEEAENLRADYERRLTEFDELMRGREAELHYAMQREREQALSDARKDAEDVRATARAEIADAQDTRGRRFASGDRGAGAGACGKGAVGCARRPARLSRSRACAA
jgi:F-type H+-transporting ATPase subunit b